MQHFCSARAHTGTSFAVIHINATKSPNSCGAHPYEDHSNQHGFTYRTISHPYMSDKHTVHDQNIYTLALMRQGLDCSMMREMQCPCWTKVANLARDQAYLLKFYTWKLLRAAFSRNLLLTKHPVIFSTNTVQIAPQCPHAWLTTSSHFLVAGPTRELLLASLATAPSPHVDTMFCNKA